MSDADPWSIVEVLLRQIDSLKIPVKHPQQQRERDEARLALQQARGGS